MIKQYCMVGAKHLDRECPDCHHDVTAHVPLGGGIFSCAACELSGEMRDYVERKFPEETE